MKTYQDLFSYMKSASAIMIAALLAVACGGGGGGGDSTVANVNGAIGTTVTYGGTTPLYDVVADYGQPSVPSVEFTLQFYGTPYNSYYGTIAAQGMMTVQDYSCGIPVGQYSVQTINQSGQFQVSNNGTVVYVPMLQATGPSTIQFTLPSVNIIQPNTAINRDVYGVQHAYRMANYGNNYIVVGNCAMTVY